MDSSQMTIVRTESSPFAAVEVRVKMTEIGQRILACFDEVYAAMEKGNLVQRGHNVAVYRNFRQGEIDMEVGVQVAAPFEPIGKVVCRQLPEGEAATLAYFGPYTGLAAAHAAVLDWVARSGRRAVGVGWEIYGDWDDDPAKLRTDVFQLLAPG